MRPPDKHHSTSLPASPSTHQRHLDLDPIFRSPPLTEPQPPSEPEPPSSPAYAQRVTIPFVTVGGKDTLGSLEAGTFHDPSTTIPITIPPLEASPSRRGRERRWGHRRSSSLNTTSSGFTRPANPPPDSRWMRGLRSFSLTTNTGKDTPTPKPILKHPKQDDASSTSANASSYSTPRRVTLSLPLRSESPTQRRSTIKQWATAAAQSAQAFRSRFRSSQPEPEVPELKIECTPLTPIRDWCEEAEDPKWSDAIDTIVGDDYGDLEDPGTPTPPMSECSLRAAPLGHRTWFPEVEDVWLKEATSREELDKLWDARYMPPPALMLAPVPRKRASLPLLKAALRPRDTPLPSLLVDTSGSWVSTDELLLTPVVSHSNCLGLVLGEEPDVVYVVPKRAEQEIVVV